MMWLHGDTMLCIALIRNKCMLEREESEEKRGEKR